MLTSRSLAPPAAISSGLGTARATGSRLRSKRTANSHSPTSGMGSARATRRAKRSGLDGHLHVPIRPTALEAAAAFAGIIVGHDVQHVVAGCVEGRGGGRLATERDARILTRDLFHFGPVVGELHAPRSPAV